MHQQGMGFDVLIIRVWITLVFLALAGCAHESTIAPSQGHIDSSNTQPDQPADIAAIPKPVISNAFVPPPKPRLKEQTYSVVVNEVPVKEILFALARESKLNIDIHPSIQGRVTLNAVDQTLPAILERLAKQVDLTYKLENNVLTIEPDQPVLRTYKVDYVNMSRDTKGFIGVAAEISSTGQSASTGAGGSAGGNSGNSQGGGSSNSSRTAVNSESKHHFWETLISNVKDLLAETDKEVIITRTGNIESENIVLPDANGATSVVPPVPANTQVTAQQQRDEARTEYKTLFAATVIANPEAGIITIRANSKQHEKVQEYLDKVMASVKRQVLIEATIVEVQLSDLYQAGINWSRMGNGFTFNQALGTTSVFTGGTGLSTGLAGTLSPFVVGYATGGSLGDLNLQLRLLQQFGDTKVLSSPKLMVLNNQTAVLKVVDNLVYFTIEAQVTQTQTTANTVFTSTPQTVPVGVVMSVTPQISSNDLVMLNVRPTISRFIDSVQDPNPNLVINGDQIPSRIPVIQVRELESLLRVNSGNTAVLGGLMQDNIADNTDSVPGLSDLPLIGKLFTAKTDLNRKTELVIFIRPTVIASASLESDELQSFKQFLPSQQLQQTVDEPAN